MREAVEKFISQWEHEAKRSMHLDALLHKRIREPLISGILKLIDRGIAAADLAAARDEASASEEPKAKPRKGKAA